MAVRFDNAQVVAGESVIPELAGEDDGPSVGGDVGLPAVREGWPCPR